MDALSRAIVDHYGLYWTQEAHDAILAHLGAEGLHEIERIISDAGAEDLWLYADQSKAYSDTQNMLRTKYPFLSEQAVMRVANSAAYGWK